MCTECRKRGKCELRAEDTGLAWMYSDQLRWCNEVGKPAYENDFHWMIKGEGDADSARL